MARIYAIPRKYLSLSPISLDEAVRRIAQTEASYLAALANERQEPQGPRPRRAGGRR